MKPMRTVGQRLLFGVQSLVVLVVAALCPGCSQPKDPWEGTPAGQPRVLVFFPPLYCFAANVAKDRANVLCLQTAIGPHDYEATEVDARKVAGADLFIVNGVGLEAEFLKKLVRMCVEKENVFAIGDGLDPKLLAPMAEHDHAGGDGHDHHHHGEHDPHIWLGPKQAQAMVVLLAKKLAEFDPAHKDDYAKNAADYLVKLKELEAYGIEQFKDKKSKSLITMHESLRYFADGFGLDLIDSIQPKPGIEADANRIARLIDICKTKNVRVIAIEPQFNRGQADNLFRDLKAKGVDVKSAVVDPMETAPPVSRGNPDANFYYERMKNNIDELAKAFP